MSEGTADGPHLDHFHAGLAQTARQLLGGGTRGDDIVDQRHMAVGEWRDEERILQIFLSLPFVQASLRWRGATAPQRLAIYRYPQTVTDGPGQLFGLIVAAPPLAPPVQGHR